MQAAQQFVALNNKGMALAYLMYSWFGFVVKRPTKSSEVVAASIAIGKYTRPYKNYESACHLAIVTNEVVPHCR